MRRSTAHFLNAFPQEVLTVPLAPFFSRSALVGNVEDAHFRISATQNCFPRIRRQGAQKLTVRVSVCETWISHYLRVDEAPR